MKLEIDLERIYDLLVLCLITIEWNFYNFMCWLHESREKKEEEEAVNRRVKGRDTRFYC